MPFNLSDLPLPATIAIIVGILAALFMGQASLKVSRLMKKEGLLYREGLEILGDKEPVDPLLDSPEKAARLFSWINRVSGESLSRQGVNTLKPLLYRVARSDKIKACEEELTTGSIDLLAACRRSMQKQAWKKMNSD